MEITTMPRPKKTAATTSTTTDVLSFLVGDRRAALEAEIVGAVLHDALGGAKSIRALFDKLTGHALWSHIGQLPTTSLTGEAARTAPAPSSAIAPLKKKLGRPKKVVPSTVGAAPAIAPHESSASAEATKGKKPAKAKAGKGGTKGKKFVRRTPEEIAAMRNNVIAFVEKNPGLNSEGIVKKMGGDAKGISDALARLREEKLVKTQGERRGMTYQIA